MIIGDLITKKEDCIGIDVDKVYKRYYEIMKNLIESQLFNIVPHPDSIKCFGYNPSFDLTETYFEIADLINHYNMSAEHNSGLYYRFGHSDLGMNKTMYHIFKNKNVHICTASDAHKSKDTGKYIKELCEI